jgi:glycosyltransferase involved in cell wall biosynthesis
MQNDEIRLGRDRQLKVCALIPVFNHAGTVGRVIEEVRAAVKEIDLEAPVIVVDDGCTDGSSEVFRELAGIELVVHARNGGKGRALMSGFLRARELGCTHVVTVDADGQHCVADVGKLVAVAREFPEEVVIGWRDMDGGGAGANVPARSKKGRDAATFWLRIQTGQMIPDSQCGLRVYPLAHVLKGTYRFWRFDFETEVLARMAWAGLRVRSVPVTCIYFEAGKRVSHFRPVMDTLRGVRVNVFLVARRLMPIPFKQLVKRDKERAKFGKWWRRETWREAFGTILRTGLGNSEIATAFAMGIFVGLTPLYGLQTLLAVYFARRLHLNVLAAVIGSQVSIPPLVPVWIVLSYGVGNLILHGRWMGTTFSTLSHQMIPAILLGNLFVALGVAGVGLIGARWVLDRVRRERVAG